MPVNDPVVALLNNAALTIQRLATAPPIKGADYPSLRLAHVLRNGAIEKELKFILAMVWEGSHGNRRACVMEKEFFGSKLDFVAFERKPRQTVGSAFWIETKCHFAEHANGVAIAKETLNQTGIYLEKLMAMRPLKDPEYKLLREQLITCDRYIVHFLNRIPRLKDSLFPRFMIAKFEGPERKRSKPLDAKKLQASYKRASNSCTHPAGTPLVYEWSEHVPIATKRHGGAVVDAVIVKLKLANSPPAQGE